MKPPSLCLTAAAALLLSGPAVASSTATSSAVLSGLQVQLFDLDPSDGQTPWISFSFDGLGANSGSASASWSMPIASGSASSSFQSDGSPWKPGTASAVTQHAEAMAQVAGTGTADGTTLLASGSATSPGDYLIPVGSQGYYFSPPTASFNANVQAPSFPGSFELSAQTVAVFSAMATVSATAIEGGTVTQDDGYGWTSTYYYGNNASAYASLSVSGPSAGGGSGSQGASDGRSAYVYSLYDEWAGSWMNGAGSDNGPIGVSFLNLTGDAMSGYLTASATVSGSAYGNMAPIPEPGSYAMLLAGLVAIAGAVRRRPAA